MNNPPWRLAEGREGLALRFSRAWTPGDGAVCSGMPSTYSVHLPSHLSPFATTWTPSTGVLLVLRTPYIGDPALGTDHVRVHRPLAIAQTVVAPRHPACLLSVARGAACGELRVLCM